MSATDDDWTAAPQGQPAPGSLRLHIPTGVLLPPHLTAQLWAVFAALAVALMTTVPHASESSPASSSSPVPAATAAAAAQPDPVARDPETGRFAYEPATGPLPDAWWVRLSFERGYPDVGALLGSFAGKVGQVRVERDGSQPVLALQITARTDESVVATARRASSDLRQRPSASTVRLQIPGETDAGISYAVAGSGDEPSR